MSTAVLFTLDHAGTGSAVTQHLLLAKTCAMSGLVVLAAPSSGGLKGVSNTGDGCAAVKARVWSQDAPGLKSVSTQSGWLSNAWLDSDSNNFNQLAWPPLFPTPVAFGKRNCNNVCSTGAVAVQCLRQCCLLYFCFSTQLHSLLT